MKYIKIVVIASMLTGIGYTCYWSSGCPEICGDLNLDGQQNVVDLILLVNCILVDSCAKYYQMQFC